MKKYFALTLAALMLSVVMVALAACGKPNNGPMPSGIYSGTITGVYEEELRLEFNGDTAISTFIFTDPHTGKVTVDGNEVTITFEDGLSDSYIYDPKAETLTLDLGELRYTLTKQSNASQNTSRKWIDNATESEKRERVEAAAVNDTLRNISTFVHGLNFDKKTTRYSIASSTRTKKDQNGNEWWEVLGKIYLYDKYGSYVETVSFQQDGMYLSADTGEAFQFGHYEYIINGKTYHN